MDINSIELKNFIDTEAMTYAMDYDSEGKLKRLSVCLNGNKIVESKTTQKVWRLNYVGDDIEKAVEIFNQL